MKRLIVILFCFPPFLHAGAVVTTNQPKTITTVNSNGHTITVTSESTSTVLVTFHKRPAAAKVRNGK